MLRLLEKTHPEVFLSLESKLENKQNMYDDASHTNPKNIREYRAKFS